MLRTFDCDWHTVESPRLEYYSGVERVTIDDDDYDNFDELTEYAEMRAQVEVWRRAFQDRPRSHIIVWNVTEMRNIRRERDEYGDNR